MSKRLDISDNTAISMPVRNMLAIIGAVAVGVWAYFGVLERITMLETKSVLAEKDLNGHIERLEADLTKNTEFRIKWPRGEMGTLPADSEQYMLIEDLYGSVEKIEKHIDSMMNNKINIEFIQKQVEKMLNDIEKLKRRSSMIVEVVVALLMIVNSEIKEHRIQVDLKSCLKGKRLAERQYSEGVRYQCLKSEAELEKNIDGSLSIKKLILK